MSYSNAKFVPITLCTVGLILACGGGGSKRSPEKKTSASWWVRGDRVENGDELASAVMDLWGGDPGLICFKGGAKGAANTAMAHFEGSERFVSAKPKGKSVVITTTDPFGEGRTDGSLFSACPPAA
ncbi:MAG: hypothetical protein GWP91_16760 [Rhodobacterales bacterium]|nr:hypothetical protein [Rhodobacterales bacterium]